MKSPKRNPLPDWTGEDVYVIGGGQSLRHFDFTQLVGRNTVGCNQAFMLGHEICNVCVFGDYRFWEQFQGALWAYGGWVVTNNLIAPAPPWLNYWPRLEVGLAKDALGWNGNTGCTATNLALILGAKRVLLLGFDMQVNSTNPTASHWHDASLEVPTAEHYLKFRGGFNDVARSLPEVFPGRTVLNVTDGTSQLRSFPTCGYEDMELAPPNRGH